MCLFFFLILIIFFIFSKFFFSLSFHITTGPANSGEFYRVQNLLLQESTSSPSGTTNWVVGQPSQTCNQVCNENGHVCDRTVMKEGAKTKEHFQTAMNDVYPCNNPLMLECSSLSTTEHMSKGRCYYSNTQQCTDSSGADGANGAEDADPCATNTDTDRRRFCACKSVRRMLKSSSRRRATLTLTASQNTIEEDEATSAQHRNVFQQEVDDAWEVGSATVHGSSAEENLPPPHQDFLYNPLTGAIIKNELNVENLKSKRSTVATDETVTKGQTTKNPQEDHPHHWQQPPLASAAAQKFSFTSLLLLTLILCLFFLVSEVDAHNWMGTPTRGSRPGANPTANANGKCGIRRPSVSSLKQKKKSPKKAIGNTCYYLSSTKRTEIKLFALTLFAICFFTST